jgi:hypothetical protein
MLLDGTAISGSPATLNSSGVASLSVKTSATGSHTLSASYSGDANYAAAGPITRTYTVTAAPAVKPSSVKLSSLTNPAQQCKPVTFSVAVSGENGDNPTGNVELKKGAQVLGKADLKNGTATLTTSALPAGINLLTASYGGDVSHSASTSGVLRQMVHLRSCSVHPLQPLQQRYSPLY